MSMNVMFYFSYGPKTTFKSRLCMKNVKILSYIWTLLWMSLHSITKICKPLVHGIISFPDVTSCDNKRIKHSFPYINVCQARV